MLLPETLAVRVFSLLVFCAFGAFHILVFHPSETESELRLGRETLLHRSLAYGALVVNTNSQCFIYQSTNWNTWRARGCHHLNLRNSIFIDISQATRRGLERATDPHRPVHA